MALAWNALLGFGIVMAASAGDALGEVVVEGGWATDVLGADARVLAVLRHPHRRRQAPLEPCWRRMRSWQPNFVSGVLGLLGFVR